MIVLGENILVEFILDVFINIIVDWVDSGFVVKNVIVFCD